MLTPPGVRQKGRLMDGIEPCAGLGDGVPVDGRATDPEQRLCGRPRAQLTEHEPKRGPPDEQ
eukprot:6456974-Alexandrium_andersonii.AAC.1